MRAAFLCLWLLVPAVVAAYHYGPGQADLLRDDAAAHLRRAETLVAEEQWPQACEAYDAALALIPTDNVEATRRVRLQRAKAQMLAAKLPEAFDELVVLSEELERDDEAPTDLIAETRDATANAQYYMTWLMRLEGRPRDDWEPLIEGARQNYRLLCEDAEARSDADSAAGHREDLEAAIRLARMDLGDLQALPLPNQ